jgi:hypothetical protein
LVLPDPPSETGGHTAKKSNQQQPGIDPHPGIVSAFSRPQRLRAAVSKRVEC